MKIAFKLWMTSVIVLAGQPVVAQDANHGDANNRPAGLTAALDQNSDGELSATEIDRVSEVLNSLDVDRNGSVEPRELNAAVAVRQERARDEAPRRDAEERGRGVQNRERREGDGGPERGRDAGDRGPDDGGNRDARSDDDRPETRDRQRPEADLPSRDVRRNFDAPRMPDVGVRSGPQGFGGIRGPSDDQRSHGGFGGPGFGPRGFGGGGFGRGSFGGRGFGHMPGFGRDTERDDAHDSGRGGEREHGPERIAGRGFGPDESPRPPRDEAQRDESDRRGRSDARPTPGAPGSDMVARRVFGMIYDRLDGNHDGNLSREEFQRLADEMIGSEGHRPPRDHDAPQQRERRDAQPRPHGARPTGAVRQSGGSNWI